MMKAAGDERKEMKLAILLMVAVILVVMMESTSSVQGKLGEECRPQLPANDTTRFANITLLSDTYIPDEFSPQLIGEVMNNGNGTTYPVTMSVFFYDKNHDIIGYMADLAQPESIEPGNRSAFLFNIVSGSIIENETTSYELLAEWREVATCLDFYHRFAP
jgi:hypothetical protein